MRLRDGRHHRLSAFRRMSSWLRKLSSFPSSRSIFSFSPCVFHSVQRLSYSSDASAVKEQSAGAKLSEFKSNQRYGALNQKGRPMKPRLHLIIRYRIAREWSVISFIVQLFRLLHYLVCEFLVATCKFFTPH